jgi:adenosylcobinamide kinase/adenosylcobinamide-phosphate guanylyltransferase
MARVTLVVGGVRSGKSRHAEQLAAAAPPVTYLATAQAGDDEMFRRIAEHRRRRPEAWRTIEEPWDVAGVVRQHTEGSLLIDCLSLWLTNLLVGKADFVVRDSAEVLEHVEELSGAITQARGRIIVVSSEVGCGIVPVAEVARRFADLLGEANQRLAALAQEVYWCVAGIPVRIKDPNDRGDGSA